jgi:hypothetical protein
MIYAIMACAIGSAPDPTSVPGWSRSERSEFFADNLRAQRIAHDPGRPAEDQQYNP